MLTALAVLACHRTAPPAPAGDALELRPTAPVEGAVIVELTPADGGPPARLVGATGDALRVDLAPGRWRIVAWVDLDGDGAWSGLWGASEPSAHLGVTVPRGPLALPLRSGVPAPRLDASPEWVALHDLAWDILATHVAAGTPENGFAPRYLDESFSPQVFQWDSVFMTLFARYGADALPVMETLDNFYGRQRDDGYIGRVIDEDDGEMATPLGPGEPMINPPLFGWSERAWATLTGDTSRLPRVLPRLDAYHGWIDANVRTGPGLYYTSMLGSGMDNAPRDAAFDGWVDITAQQALGRDALAWMAEQVGADPAPHRAERDRVCADVHDRMFADGWFRDLGPGGAPLPDKTLAGVWPLVAGCADADQAAAAARWLGDPAAFWRAHAFASTAADSPAFEPDGHYWRGGVWAPTEYAAVQGLDRYGHAALAEAAVDNHLMNLAAVADRFTPAPGELAPDAPSDGAGTLWELYAPDDRRPGTRWDDTFLGRSEFVGWSGLGPVALLYEEVLGLRPDALTDTLRLRVRRTDAHGVAGYRFGDQLVDVDVAARAPGGPIAVSVTTSDAFTLVVETPEAPGWSAVQAVPAGGGAWTFHPTEPAPWVPAGPHPGYAVLGNGRVQAVVAPDGELAHLHVGDFGVDRVERGGTRVADASGATIAPSRVGLAPWFAAAAEVPLPDGGRVTWRTFVGPADAVVVEGALVGGPAGSSATLLPWVTLRAEPDMDGGVRPLRAEADGAGLRAAWSDGAAMALGSAPAAARRQAGGAAAQPPLDGQIADGRTLALELPLTAAPGASTPFRWWFGDPPGDDPFAAAAALHAPHDLTPRCGATDACRVASANLAAAAASRLGGAVPADVTGQFVTLGAPQLYPRDAMMVARALRAAGQDDDARTILRSWLATPGPAPGEWYARYDARGRAVDGGTGAAFDEPEWDANAYAALLARDLGPETWSADEREALLTALDLLVARQDPDGLWTEGGIVEWTGNLPGTAMAAWAGLDAGAELAEAWGEPARAADYLDAAGRARGGLPALYHADRDLLGDRRDGAIALDTSLLFGPVFGFPAWPALSRTWRSVRDHHLRLGGGVPYFEGNGYGDDLFFFTTAAFVQYGLTLGEDVTDPLAWMLSRTNSYALAPERVYDDGGGAAPASPLSWCAAELALTVLAARPTPEVDGEVEPGEYAGAGLIDVDGAPDTRGDPVALYARREGAAVVIGLRTAGAPPPDVQVWLTGPDGAGPLTGPTFLTDGEPGALRRVDLATCADCRVVWGARGVEASIPAGSLPHDLQVVVDANGQRLPPAGALRAGGEDGSVLVTFEVEAADVPAGRVVTLSGDRPELGGWRGDAIGLIDDGTRGDRAAGDGVWSATVRLPRGGWISWKQMTGQPGDGSWDGVEFEGADRAIPIGDPDGNGRVRVATRLGERGEDVRDP